MNSPILVSIISPCYNGEQYVHRMLDSILNQTYPKIEIIFINDGSTDKTEDILVSYEKKFKERKYTYIHLYQENAGQSAAINRGLTIFTGDYLLFVDSDDILDKKAIEKKVKYLDNHPNVGLVLNKIKALDFETLKELFIMERKTRGDLFKDLISGHDVFYTPGGYFWRSSMFREAMPTPLQIQAPREIGQNFQLLLPIAYKFPIGYLDDCLYYYLIRKDSHSHTKHTLTEYLHNWDVARGVINNIITDIEKDSTKVQELNKLVDIRYHRERMNLFNRYGKKNERNKEKRKLIQLESNGSFIMSLILNAKYFNQGMKQNLISFAKVLK